ncbi:MAG: hypothetical protein GVY29_07580 [Spirochaetes bacterium]|jgi:hypothetical protein|nr:hypothetical protein [Spirochaetota bacterium]
MKHATLFAIAVVALVATGCSTAPSIVSNTEPASPVEQLVWVGTGTSWVYADGQWVRTPEQDYRFMVRQNRYADRWESLKVQNRTHPDYDGTAGPADQQHSFTIRFGEARTDGTIPIELTSTYGNGTGWTDDEYWHAVLEFEAADVSRFAPYNRFRITQEYRYDEGVLLETVELFEVDQEGRETPFARIEEEARMFYPR